MQRLAAESAAVEDRTISIQNRNELEAFLTEAEDKLVMLNVETEALCDVGFDINDPAACAQFKSDLARVAAECEDVVFLNLDIEDSSEALALSNELGVNKFPTQQYYKNGSLVWQHEGAGVGTMESVGEGVLYYGGQGAGGMSASKFITEVKSDDDLTDFLELCALPETNDMGVTLQVQCDKQLAVLDCSKLNDAPSCMAIFPAVLALAKNTAGATRWARLLCDADPTSASLAQKYNVTQYPTFIFFADGKEVDRVVTADRMTLMNHVLEFQAANGVSMPQPSARKRLSNSEAKKIAQAKRAAQKKQMF